MTEKKSSEILRNNIHEGSTVIQGGRQYTVGQPKFKFKNFLIQNTELMTIYEVYQITQTYPYKYGDYVYKIMSLIEPGNKIEIKGLFGNNKTQTRVTKFLREMGIIVLVGKERYFNPHIAVKSTYGVDKDIQKLFPKVLKPYSKINITTKEIVNDMFNK